MAAESRECGKCKKDKSIKERVEMRAEGERGMFVCYNGHKEEMTGYEQMSSLGCKQMFD